LSTVARLSVVWPGFPPCPSLPRSARSLCPAQMFRLFVLAPLRALPQSGADDVDARVGNSHGLVMCCCKWRLLAIIGGIGKRGGVQSDSTHVKIARRYHLICENEFGPNKGITYSRSPPSAKVIRRDTKTEVQNKCATNARAPQGERERPRARERTRARVRPEGTQELFYLPHRCHEQSPSQRLHGHTAGALSLCQSAPIRLVLQPGVLDSSLGV